MKVTHPFGLALSGGGFRATAFHLGVLKRLRELGLLAQVDVLSTVSGGSIAGAYWVYWQSFKGDTLASDEEWAKFEASLIDFMQSGVRERIVRKAFTLPVILGVGGILGGHAWGFGPTGPIEALLLCLGMLFGAYLLWHYNAPNLLEREYERLFEATRLSDLEVRGSDCEKALVRGVLERFGRPLARAPDLFINATLLNTGDQMLFSSNQDREIESLSVKTPLFATMPLIGLKPINEAITGFDPFLPGLTRPQISVPMPSETLLSKAVASSSAIPFVFSPVRFVGPLRNVVGPMYKKLWGAVNPDGVFLSVDGGVFDNQGTQLLLKKACSSIIISDGSGALTPRARPSTWQMLPPGKGVVPRSFDITYQRSRDLGYIRVADKHELFCMLTDFSMLIGMPELAPAVVDAVWANNRRDAEFYGEPARRLKNPQEIFDYLLKKDRNLSDAAWPYDKELLSEFRAWSRDPSQMKAGKYRKPEAYWRNQMLKKLEKYGPYVTGYAYVELAPNDDFRWDPGMPRLPTRLIPLIASVRTDLDRFSSEEISAVMFHGYTTINHCVSAYVNDWMPASHPPCNFAYPGKGIFRDWSAPTEAEISTAARHLSVSQSRIGLWRLLYRRVRAR